MGPTEEAFGSCVVGSSLEGCSPHIQLFPSSLRGKETEIAIRLFLTLEADMLELVTSHQNSSNLLQGRE